MSKKKKVNKGAEKKIKVKKASSKQTGDNVKSKAKMKAKDEPLIRKKNVKMIKICPRCGSPDVFTDYTSSASIVLGEINRLRCRNCNYSGTLFKEVEVDKLKDHKVLKKKELKGETEMVNTSYGSGIRPYFYIIGIVTIAGGILVLRMKWWVSGAIVIAIGLAQILYALFARKRK